MVALSKRGYRQKEPAEIFLGQPSLLARSVELVKDSLIFLETILKTQKVSKISDVAIQAMKRQSLAQKAKIVSF